MLEQWGNGPCFSEGLFYMMKRRWSTWSATLGVRWLDVAFPGGRLDAHYGAVLEIVSYSEEIGLEAVHRLHESWIGRSLEPRR